MKVYTAMSASAGISVVLSVIVSVVLSAPVAEQSLDGIKEALRSQIKNQEQALESLSTVPKLGSHGQEFTKTKSFSYTNNNGAVSSVRQDEEKVSESETEKLISDIKQKIAQSQESPEVAPKTQFKASIDIPEKGVHKIISNDEPEMDLSELSQSEEEQINPLVSNTVEFTPEVVAEYLLRTGEQQEFQNLLNELVEAGEISPEDAEKYEKSVMDALYKLQQQFNNVNGPSMEAQYPQGFGEGPQSMFPTYNGYPMQDNEDVYPLYGFGSQQTKPIVQDNNNNMDSYINFLLNKPVTLDEMISTLLDEWLNRAIVTGDPEAEEILSNIVDYVSRDNNPDDESQVKAILGDIFAEALLEDLTPRIEPQGMNNVDYLPQQMKPIVSEDIETVQGMPRDSGDELEKTGEELESIETDDTQSAEMAAHTTELEDSLKM